MWADLTRLDSYFTSQLKSSKWKKKKISISFNCISLLLALMAITYCNRIYYTHRHTRIHAHTLRVSLSFDMLKSAAVVTREREYLKKCKRCCTVCFLNSAYHPAFLYLNLNWDIECIIIFIAGLWSIASDGETSCILQRSTIIAPCSGSIQQDCFYNGGNFSGAQSILPPVIVQYCIAVQCP